MRTIRPRHHTGAYPLVAFEVTERDAAAIAAALIVAADQYAADAETCAPVLRAADQFREQERTARELAKAFDLDGGGGRMTRVLRGAEIKRAGLVLGPRGEHGIAWGPVRAAIRVPSVDKTPIVKVGGIVHYNGQRLRDMRLVGMHSRNKRPASRSGNLVAPWDHERPQCFVCGGFALGDGPRCQWCTSDGRARSFCLDCGRWLPGCKCMLDAGVLVCRADEDAP